MNPTIDIEAIEARIHAAPPSELTPIALALVSEVRRLRGELEELRKPLPVIRAEE